MYYVGEIQGQSSSVLVELFVDAAHTDISHYPIADTKISLHRGCDRTVAIMESPVASVIVSSPASIEGLCAIWKVTGDDTSLAAIDADGVVTISDKDTDNAQDSSGFFGSTLSIDPELYNGAKQRADIMVLIEMIERAFD